MTQYALNRKSFLIPTIPNTFANLSDAQKYVSQLQQCISDISQSLQIVTGLGFVIGQIYISILSTDPSISLGFGTWVIFGTGRIVLDVDVGAPENLSSTVTVYLWKRTA